MHFLTCNIVGHSFVLLLFVASRNLYEFNQELLQAILFFFNSIVSFWIQRSIAFLFLSFFNDITYHTKV